MLLCCTSESDTQTVSQGLYDYEPHAPDVGDRGLGVTYGDNHNGNNSCNDNHGDDNDNDNEIVDEPDVLARTELAKTIREYFVSVLHFESNTNQNNSVERTRTAATLAVELEQPDFVQLIRQFLFDQLHPDESVASYDHRKLPEFHGKVHVYTSAVSTFRAPSDLSGLSGMRRERIRAMPSWGKGPARYDCVFVNTGPAAEGFQGLNVARVRLFFSIKFGEVIYPCALIHWMIRVGDEPDDDTGMWIVKPDLDANGLPHMSVIHLDCILRAAHLIGVCGKDFLPKGFSYYHSLDAFLAFYVNKFIDHHAFEIAS